MAQYKKVKGTLDLLPQTCCEWEEIEKIFARVCRSFAYGEIRIPTFEYTEVFNRGVGETSDIVQKEMYTFEDRGGRSITLRPEGTAGVVRAFVENGLFNETLPQRLFYEISAFRAENVQKGRYREFHQLGVECLGSQSPMTDVEIISLVQLFFQQVGLKNYEIRLNSLGSIAGRKAYYQALLAYLTPHTDELCSDCRQRMAKNPLRVLDCKVPQCKAVVLGAPKITDCLLPEDQQRFQTVLQGLDNLSIKYTVDPKIVRGLDYYCHTVFEFVLNDVEAGQAATICGGGRYDGLVTLLGGPDLPGMGFSIGLERLHSALQEQKRAYALRRPDLFIVAQSEAERQVAAGIVWHLRRLGITVEQDVEGRSFKAQMKYMNKHNFRYCLVLGENELNSKIVKLKDLDSGSELNEQFNLDDLTDLNKAISLNTTWKIEEE